MRRRRPGQPVPIGELLAAVVPGVPRPAPDLWGAWRAAAGELIAGHTLELRLSGRTLSVRVDATPWVVELRAIEGLLLRRLKTQAPEAVVERLHIHDR